MTNRQAARYQKRQVVLNTIIAMGMKPFTAAELAEATNISTASATGTIGLLKRDGYVDHQGWVTTARKNSTTMAVMTYMWTGKTDPVKKIRTQKWVDRKHLETLG